MGKKENMDRQVNNLMVRLFHNYCFSTKKYENKLKSQFEKKVCTVVRKTYLKLR